MPLGKPNFVSAGADESATLLNTYPCKPSLTPLQAVQHVLARLYQGIPLPSTLQPNKTQKQSERNAEIRQRHAAGEALFMLAQAFGISKQRVHQIVADSES